MPSVRSKRGPVHYITLATIRGSIEPTSGECLKCCIAGGLETESGMPALAEGSINRPGPRPRQQYDAPYYLSAGGYLVVVGIISRLQQQVAHRQTPRPPRQNPAARKLRSRGQKRGPTQA